MKTHHLTEKSNDTKKNALNLALPQPADTPTVRIFKQRIIMHETLKKNQIPSSKFNKTPTGLDVHLSTR